MPTAALLVRVMKHSESMLIP